MGPAVALRRPPPTGPMITTPMPDSWARAMAASFFRSIRLYCTVIESNFSVSITRIRFSGVSWKLKARNRTSPWSRAFSISL